MPELSRFFGIVIQMFSEAGERHRRPHFHTKYQGVKAVFGIRPVELMAGSLPLRQRRLVEARAELHQEELLRDWELLDSGSRPEKIEPLH